MYDFIMVSPYYTHGPQQAGPRKRCNDSNGRLFIVLPIPPIVPSFAGVALVSMSPLTYTQNWNKVNMYLMAPWATLLLTWLTLCSHGDAHALFLFAYLYCSALRCLPSYKPTIPASFVLWSQWDGSPSNKACQGLLQHWGQRAQIQRTWCNDELGRPSPQGTTRDDSG